MGLVASLPLKKKKKKVCICQNPPLCVCRIAVYYIFCTHDCKWQKPVFLNISATHIAYLKSLL